MCVHNYIRRCDFMTVRSIFFVQFFLMLIMNLIMAFRQGMSRERASYDWFPRMVTKSHQLGVNNRGYRDLGSPANYPGLANERRRITGVGEAKCSSSVFTQLYRNFPPRKSELPHTIFPYTIFLRIFVAATSRPPSRNQLSVRLTHCRIN